MKENMNTHQKNWGLFLFNAPLNALLIAVFILYQPSFSADAPRQTTKKGIQHYNQKEYDKALAEFLAGIEAAPERSELKYDAGTALYKLEDFKNATGAFGQAAMEEKSKIASEAWYNLGNTLYKSNDLEKAIQAYKNSLYLDHGHADAKHNLEMALRMQQMQQQQQKGDSTQQQQQKQEQKKEEEQKEQDQQQQAQAEQKEDDKEQQKPQPQEEKQTEMSREEALQLLQAMENDEQEAQKEKLERQFGQPKRVEKDW